MIRYIGLLTVTLLLTISCSDGSETETAQVSTSAPTATAAPIPAATATPAPTQVPPTATPTAMAAPIPTATATAIPTPTQVPPTATPTQVLPTPTPTQVPPTPTPTPTITGKEKLISIGYNVPKTGSIIDVNQEFIGGLNLDPGYKERFVEVQNSLNSVLGGYQRYIYLAYDPNGTEEDAKPLFERLTEVQFPGDTNSSNYVKNWTIEDLDKYKTCLGGADAGKRKTSTTDPYSICLESLKKIYAYSREPGPPTAKNYAQLAIHYAHEYFHHYQKVHALDRGLDLQADRDNPETTVQAPRWWIEGAAVTFSNAWYKSNWESLSFLKGQVVMHYGSEFNLANANNGDLATANRYKEIKQMVRGELPENKMRGGLCSSDWSMSVVEENAIQPSGCDASLMAVAYMAHLTSWKTVWIDIIQDYYDLGFWGSFEKHIGMTNQEFYDAYNNLLRSGDIDDDPPEGWTFPEGPISDYADFLKIVPESD